MYLKLGQLFAGLCLGLCISVPSLAVEVTLMVAYDNFSKNRFGNDPQTAISNWVRNINKVYQNSDVDIQLKLVHTVNHNPNGNNMRAILGNIRQSQKLKNLRNEYKADFVSQIHQKGRCGIGYVSLSPGYAFNMVGPQCGYLSMAHELGHNMGLHHSRKQGKNSGLRYRYGLGYGVNGSFATVMAYPSAFNTNTRVTKFSNPNKTCKNRVCGVPIGQDKEAFAAQALNNVKNLVANHRKGNSGGGTNNPTPTQPPNNNNNCPASHPIFSSACNQCFTDQNQASSAGCAL